MSKNDKVIKELMVKVEVDWDVVFSNLAILFAFLAILYACET